MFATTRSAAGLEQVAETRHARMQSVLRTIAGERQDRQQHVARHGEILARRRVDVVFGDTARHDHVERIVAAEEKDAHERLVVGERGIAADELGAHRTRNMRQAHARNTEGGVHKETSAIQCGHGLAI